MEKKYRRKTHEQYIAELSGKRRGKEFTVLSVYKGAKHPIKLKHDICGYEFEYKHACSFLNVVSCSRCSNKKAKTTDEFKQEVSEQRDGDEYEVMSDYLGANAHVIMKHKCGFEYPVTPHNFLSGCRCPRCAGRYKTTDDVKEEIFISTDGEYELCGEYISYTDYVQIKHNLCGEIYSVKMGNFRSSKRCPVCKESKGVTLIRKWLSENKIPFKREYIIKGCKNKRPLPFDFAINRAGSLILVEYDGIQHFKPTFGHESFSKTQTGDRIKNEYCRKHGIKLIRIPYWDFDRIEEILTEQLKELIDKADKTETVS